VQQVGATITATIAPCIDRPIHRQQDKKKVTSAKQTILYVLHIGFKTVYDGVLCESNEA